MRNYIHETNGASVAAVVPWHAVIETRSLSFEISEPLCGAASQKLQNAMYWQFVPQSSGLTSAKKQTRWPGCGHESHSACLLPKMRTVRICPALRLLPHPA